MKDEQQQSYFDYQQRQINILAVLYVAVHTALFGTFIYAMWLS